MEAQVCASEGSGRPLIASGGPFGVPRRSKIYRMPLWQAFGGAAEAIQLDERGRDAVVSRSDPVLDVFEERCRMVDAAALLCASRPQA